MPTYSYRCTECGEAFDIQQAFTDDTLSVCPNCGGKLRKLFNAVGVSFTGSGFYRNDSRAAVPSGASEGSSGSSGSSESSGSSSESSSSSSAAPKSDSSSSSTSSSTSAAPATANKSKKE